MKNSHLALELVKFRTLGKPYSKWRAIMAELGGSDTPLLIFLRDEFGILIDKREDPMLFCINDTQQMKLLLNDGIPSPTILQLMLTSKSWALTEEAAIAKWKAVMQPENVTGEN